MERVLQDPITLIFFINNGDFGPIQKKHDVYKGFVDDVYRRVHVDRIGFVLAVHV